MCPQPSASESRLWKSSLTIMNPLRTYIHFAHCPGYALTILWLKKRSVAEILESAVELKRVWNEKSHKMSSMQQVLLLKHLLYVPVFMRVTCR